MKEHGFDYFTDDVWVCYCGFTGYEEEVENHVDQENLTKETEMRTKLKEIVNQAYCNRCQYNTEDSIKDSIWALLDAHKINVSFFVCTTGIEFSENIFKYGMSGQLAIFSRTKIYFINF